MGLKGPSSDKTKLTRSFRNITRTFMERLESVFRVFRRVSPTETAIEIINRISGTGRKGYACPHSLEETTLHNWRLPVELWWHILQFAVEPSFATDQIFLPQNIQFYHSALIIHHFSNPGNTHVQRTKAALRLVCKDFKLIVDKSINTYDRCPTWISPYSPDLAQQYGPACRLDLRFDRLWDINSVKSLYPHEAKIVTIQARQFDLESKSARPTLASFLSKPWSVTVLHLSFFHTLETPHSFPIDILHALSLLHTLSIASHRPIKVDGLLSMTQIRSLFLCFDYSSNSDLSQWSFPNLVNLSIDTRCWPASNHAENLAIGFADLLSRHKDHIRSLRLFPCRGFDSSQQSVPVLLRSMPHLESLATDFAKYAPFSRHSSILAQVVDLWPNATTAFRSLKNLIHVSTHPYGSHLVSSILLESLGSTPRLQTLAITDEPFLERVDGYWSEENDDECMASLRELDDICRHRGIKIIGEMGMEKCCVFKTWRTLSKIQMPPEMASFFGRT